jgi:hypothetical protein
MDQLEKINPKHVSTWKIKKLINMVCQETPLDPKTKVNYAESRVRA